MEFKHRISGNSTGDNVIAVKQGQIVHRNNCRETTRYLSLLLYLHIKLYRLQCIHTVYIIGWDLEHEYLLIKLQSRTLKSWEPRDLKIRKIKDKICLKY